MKQAFLAGVMVAGLVAPASVNAEPTIATTAQLIPVQSPGASPDSKTEQVFVIRPVQILAIGAGVVTGAIVVEALFSTDLGLLVGGAVGGYIANLWYNGRQLEIHLGAPPKI